MKDKMNQQTTQELVVDVAAKMGADNPIIIHEVADIIDTVKIRIGTEEDLREVARRMLRAMELVAAGKSEREIFKIGGSLRALFIGITARVVAGMFHFTLDDLRGIWDNFRDLMD